MNHHPRPRRGGVSAGVGVRGEARRAEQSRTSREDWGMINKNTHHGLRAALVASQPRSTGPSGVAPRSFERVVGETAFRIYFSPGGRCSAWLLAVVCEEWRTRRCFEFGRGGPSDRGGGARGTDGGWGSGACGCGDPTV